MAKKNVIVHQTAFLVERLKYAIKIKTLLEIYGTFDLLKTRKLICVYNKKSMHQLGFKLCPLL